MDEIFEFAFVPVKGTKKTDFLPGDPPELVRQGLGCSTKELIVLVLQLK